MRNWKFWRCGEGSEERLDRLTRVDYEMFAEIERELGGDPPPYDDAPEFERDFHRRRIERFVKSDDDAGVTCRRKFWRGGK